MDRTLFALLCISAVSISLVAPLATVMVATILGLTTLVTWGSWSLVRGVGQPQPEVQRVWDDQ
jgi:hypothetical protein